MKKKYTDIERKFALIEWFIENNFFNNQINVYIKRFEIILKIEDLELKKQKILEFQTEILNELDNMSIDYKEN